MKTITILLIEDNTSDVRLIREMLKEITHFKTNLFSACTIMEGYEVIQKNSFDIILLDLNLPDSTGAHTFHKAADCCQDIPIVLITGTEDEELSLKLIHEGAQDYLTKQNLSSALLGKSILFSIERKQREKELRLSEEKLRNYINNAPDGILIIDTSGRYIQANKTACSVLGYTEDEILHLSITDLLAEESFNEGLAHFTKLMETGKAKSELQHKHKDGSIRWLAINAIKISETEFLGFAKDVTERKKTENALKVSEEKHRLLADKLTDVIWLMDLKGKSLFVSKSIEKFTGFTVEEYLAQSITDRFTPESAGLAISIMKNEIGYYTQLEVQPKDYQKRLVLDYICKDGSIKTGELLVSPYFDENNKPIGLHGLVRDITERKKLEEALIKSELQFRELYQNAKIGLYRTTPDGTILMANIALVRMLGYSSFEKLAERNLEKDGFEPNYKRKEFIDKIEKDGEINDFESAWKRPDGTTFFVRESAQAVRNSDGLTMYYNGVVENITERKKNEDEIAMLSQSMKSVKECVSITDTEDKILFVNQAFLETYGYELTELIGKSINLVRSLKNDHNRISEIIPSTIRGEWQGELINKRKDGSEFPISLSTTIIKDKEGKILGLIGVASDITERKQAEKKLQQSEEKFRSYIESAPNGVFVTDEKGRYIEVNKSACTMMGYTEEEFLKISIQDILPDESFEDGMNHFKKLLHEGAAKGDYLFKCKGGEKKWFSIDAVKLSETRFLGFTTDITERKQLENDLIAAKEKAEENDRLKTAFLANMSHEIRTPMNGIMGFTNLLKEPKLTGEEQHEYIGIIEKSGARLLNIINDIISISKVESGNAEISISETNINEQVEFIYNFFKLEAELKGLHLTYKNSLPDINAIINTDREKVYAILTNLVNNAIKFTPEGSIEFGYEKKGNFLEFYVKDTGVGVAPFQKDLIFERFRQGSELLSRNYEGAGLGLSISKAFVEMLGGKIWVETSSGNNLPNWDSEKRGAKFFFTIPFNPVHKEKYTDSLDLVYDVIENKVGTLKILIAEDDEVSMELISIVTKDIAKEVVKVGNGYDAVEACRINSDIDLVLMDIKMPVMDGLEATRQIRLFNKDIIIVAQTAFVYPEDKKKAIESGCNDYIPKPIMKEGLMAILQTYFTN
jgi:PAS domain S-box-containing protein